MDEADDRNGVMVKGAGDAAAQAHCKQPDADVYLSREPGSITSCCLSTPVARHTHTYTRTHVCAFCRSNMAVLFIQTGTVLMDVIPSELMAGRWKLNSSVCTIMCFGHIDSAAVF